MSRSIFAVVQENPTEFLSRVLVEQIARGRSTEDILASNAAKSLGVDCLVSEDDRKWNPVGKTEREQIVNLYIRHITPIIQEAIHSPHWDQFKQDADPKYWQRSTSSLGKDE